MVVGVGPGLGEAVAERFAGAGCDLALLARSEEYLRGLAADLSGGAGDVRAVPTDVTDPEAVAAGFDTVRRRLGSVDVLVDCLYSTETGDGGIREEGADALHGAWDVEVAGVARCVRAALPDLLDGGTVILTNSALSKRAAGDATSRSVARFGLRGLAQSLARDLGPDGVHVSHVVVDGWIDKPALREHAPDRPDEAWIDPASIADTYWGLVTQDRSAWTFELDVRTHTDDLGV